jgi:hypothetical protein
MIRILLLVALELVYLVALARLCQIPIAGILKVAASMLPGVGNMGGVMLSSGLEALGAGRRRPPIAMRYDAQLARDLTRELFPR